MNSETKPEGVLSGPPTEGRPARRITSARTVPHRAGADAYDAIVWRLRGSEANPGEGFAVGVLGCHRRCGATTVAANTAIRFADHGLGPVLLIECNTAHPRLSRAFRLGKVAGLGEAAAGRADLSDCIHATRIEGLDVMPLGAIKAAGSASGIAGQFAALLSEVRSEYAVVLMDLPPADRVIGGLLPIAQEADAVLLVLRSETTQRRAASGALHQLTQDGVPVIGSVVTRRKRLSPRWFGSGL